MLPTYTPHRYRGRGNGVYLVLIVVLSVALVAQFVYWKRQVSDLVLEVGGVHMRMAKQESTARRVMEEKAALGKLNEFLQDGLNTCETEKMEKASEIEDFRVKHGTLQANYDQLQRECKELGVRAAEAEERTADLKEELGNLLNNSDAVTTTTIMEPVEVKNPVTVVEIGDVYGTPERVDAAEGTAVQTGGVDEAYANETMEAAAKVADGDALGLLEQLNQHQEQLDEEEQQEVTEEGSLDGVIENTEEWSQQEGTPKLVRPPDLIATGGTLEGEEAADGTDTGNEEQLGYGSEDNESLLQTTKRSVLQAVLAGRED